MEDRVQLYYTISSSRCSGGLVQRSEEARSAKKDWEVDIFGTIGNLLRGRRKFG